MVPFLGICDFVKKNLWLSMIAGVLLLFVLFGKQMNRLFGIRAKRRRRRTMKPVRRPQTRSGKKLPRSAGRRYVRAPARSKSTKGYPAVGGGTIPYKYNKDGTVKKGWQVSGTIAAKRRMSGLRRKR